MLNFGLKELQFLPPYLYCLSDWSYSEKMRWASVSLSNTALLPITSDMSPMGAPTGFPVMAYLNRKKTSSLL